MTKANEPAFPHYHSIGNCGTGLSKREYFSALAMQGIMADGQTKDIPSIATAAVMVADALLAELEKGEKE
jgi:hypothetical protein